MNESLQQLSRRKMLQTIAAAWLATTISCPKTTRARAPFHFCLNTSTINGRKLGVLNAIEIAAAAGYDGVEVWMQDVRALMNSGQGPSTIREKAQDLDIRIVSAITFPRWIVDDELERQKAMEELRQELAIMAEMGCPLMAAPPVGATTGHLINLYQAAERYRCLLDLCQEYQVIPQLEIWGFSANLHSLGEALFIAAQSGHPRASILADVYHLYRGGSFFDSLKYIPAEALHLFHMNDYPVSPSAKQLKDSDRVLPGEGIAPWKLMIEQLRAKEKPITLSLELFRQDLWEQPPLLVAQKGLQAMKSVVDAA